MFKYSSAYIIGFFILCDLSKTWMYLWDWCQSKNTVLQFSSLVVMQQLSVIFTENMSL